MELLNDLKTQGLPLLKKAAPYYFATSLIMLCIDTDLTSDWLVGLVLANFAFAAILLNCIKTYKIRMS